MSGSGAERKNGGGPGTVTTVSATDATQIADQASFFECPVCLDYALPPIYQLNDRILFSSCAAGHLLCSQCRPKITNCPSCRGPIGESIRFLAPYTNRPGDVDWGKMQSCFDQHFMIALQKQDGGGAPHFYVAVQLFGSKKQSEKYAYRLELSCGRKRLVWEHTCGSIRDGISTAAIQQSGHLSFDDAIAQSFAENGNLAVDITIVISDPYEQATPG